MKNKSKKSAVTAQTSAPVNQNQPLEGIYLKRAQLRQLSQAVAPLVKEGKFPNVNTAILDTYKKDGHQFFRSFEEWKKAGKQVIKGSKAFIIWGAPLPMGDVEESQKFFPIKFLFSNLQVQEFKKGENPTTQETPTLYGLSEIEVSYKPTKLKFDPEKIGSSSDVYKLFYSFFANHMEHREAFYCLYLNRQNQPLGIFQASIGGVTGTVVDPKLIMQIALKSHACNLILAHNHPSGNLKPSDADIDLTKKIKNACDFMDISLLDHIILTEDSHYSFADEGKI